MDFKFFSKQSILSPQEQKQRKLFFILIGVILATLIVVYFSFFRATPSSPVIESIADSEMDETQEVTNVGTQEIIEKINFDAGFFNDPQFQVLRVYGEWPLETEIKGRANPFLPY
ncbi:MAG: hypothetical protein CMI55_04110 [Parcubacteria group bacterium]|jgi:hypothetical protein|nr:hypothetical protein [Parcubacteria group bacterium]|tara:strand:+ start:3224 stop:3568 length:345 start_codon:yes stop_codon:yes gene_type:complete